MKNSTKIKIMALVCTLCIVALVLIFVFAVKINHIEVTGNEKYSDKKIEEMIFKDKWMKSPIVFFFRTKFGKQESIPFVAKYEINMKSLTSVKISVYEKNVVGYIEYFGTNMYFDKDGIVSESSSEVLEGIPKITGIKFDYIVLQKKIPVEDDKLFSKIMDITQLLNKYSISVDKIYISGSMEMTLYMGDVKVELGDGDNLNEKIIDLNDMRENLNGLSGTLDMKQYDSADEGYTFKKNQ